MTNQFTHDEGVKLACLWLRRIGCKLVFPELNTHNNTGEIPDAIGFARGVSYLVEVKTSRSDYRSDGRKHFRQRPNLGVGNWRVYFAPAERLKKEYFG
jgi:Holliday junction resolvase-like predicted endonuclease